MTANAAEARLFPREQAAIAAMVPQGKTSEGIPSWNSTGDK